MHCMLSLLEAANSHKTRSHHLSGARATSFDCPMYMPSSFAVIRRKNNKAPHAAFRSSSDIIGGGSPCSAMLCKLRTWPKVCQYHELRRATAHTCSPGQGQHIEPSSAVARARAPKLCPYPPCVARHAWNFGMWIATTASGQKLHSDANLYQNGNLLSSRQFELCIQYKILPRRSSKPRIHAVCGFCMVRACKFGQQVRKAVFSRTVIGPWLQIWSASAKSCVFADRDWSVAANLVSKCEKLCFRGP